jgi:hypothetical protein
MITQGLGILKLFSVIHNCVRFPVLCAFSFFFFLFPFEVGNRMDIESRNQMELKIQYQP